MVVLSQKLKIDRKLLHFTFIISENQFRYRNCLKQNLFRKNESGVKLPNQRVD